MNLILSTLGRETLFVAGPRLHFKKLFSSSIPQFKSHRNTGWVAGQIEGEMPADHKAWGGKDLQEPLLCHFVDFGHLTFEDSLYTDRMKMTSCYLILLRVRLYSASKCLKRCLGHNKHATACFCHCEFSNLKSGEKDTPRQSRAGFSRGLGREPFLYNI